MTEKIIACAYDVHTTLGAGFLEKVYENALAIELEATGIDVRVQAKIDVMYRERNVGEFFADLLVPGVLVIELKAGRSIAVEHV